MGSPVLTYQAPGQRTPWGVSEWSIVALACVILSLLALMLIRGDGG